MDSMKHDTTRNDTKTESETLTEAAIFHQIQSNLIEFFFPHKEENWLNRQ